VVFSFCRKTTLTKHARRQHQISENGAETEVYETDEDSPGALSNSGKPKSSKFDLIGDTAQSKKAIKRVVKKNSLLSTMPFQQLDQFNEAIIPYNSRDLHSTPPSRHHSFSSGSTSGSGFNDTQLALSMNLSVQQPLTPPSYYDEDDRRSISPAMVIHPSNGYHTPVVSQPGSVNGSFSSGLRIECESQSPHQLLIAAQRAHEEHPGSVSSCSSTTTGSQSSDYFGSSPQNPSNYYPITPGADVHFGGHVPHDIHQFDPYGQTAYGIQQVTPVHMHPQDIWYVQSNQHLVTQRLLFSDFGPEDMMKQQGMDIKQEPVESMLPTPRGSFCWTSGMSPSR
jgi:hypothetical protein